MTNLSYATALLISTGLIGCTTSFSEYSIFGDPRFRQENLAQTVKKRRNGEYVVEFRTEDIEPLGGIAERRTVVPKYLEQRKLIPADCPNGIEVLSVGSYQGGHYHLAIFRCNAKVVFLRLNSFGETHFGTNAVSWLSSDRA